MEYTTIGNTNIKVSKLCIGCRSFGQKGTRHDWTLDPGETENVVRFALDNGINFFDTANCYSKGTSEEYLAEALWKNTTRDKVVLASKVYFNEGRLSKAAIKREIEGTLTRLKTTYLDLYIIHRFDYQTPIEETMSALNDLVKEGKVRAIGASARYGYQFYNRQRAAKDHGWTPFSARENHYNLLYREDERERIPICMQRNVRLRPYSPLAGGHLCRNTWDEETLRSKTDKVLKGKYDNRKENDLIIIHRVDELARKHGCKRSQIALSWHFAKGVSSPIIGGTKVAHIEDAIKALSIHLNDDEIRYLEEPYLPHPIVGAIRENPKDGVVLLDKKN